jgi:amino acid adenylation domain
LHYFIEVQAAKTPDAPALVFDDIVLSYSELNGQANYFANLLKERGVGPEVIVGVCAERSIEIVVALLAILKAGGAYMPLDPSLPAKRLAYMIAESKTPLVALQSKFKELFGETVPQLNLDSIDFKDKRISENPVCTAGPRNIAYVIYTSGSTGTPKGVMNRHDGIVNRLFWMQEEFNIGQSDAVMQKTPFSFDVSVWEFFWPLMTGARLVIAKPGGHKDPDYLLDLIQRERVTVMHFVPSMLRHFLLERGIERSNTLRYVICSGEVLEATVNRQFFERCNAALYNLYGPTEAAVDVTCWKCVPDNTIKNVPIGFPIDNIAIAVFDERGGVVPRGETGELCIAGVGVARGYINRDDLTSQKFVQRNIGEAWTNWYTTGDLARIRSDGAIEYLGRIDNQVKLRGLRIELGEIETCLEQQKGVRRAVVMMREDIPGNQVLVGYIQENEPGAFTAAEANKGLAEELPEYMLPAKYVIVKEFPLSSNGKLDRKHLPPPSRERPPISQPYIAPRTEIERSLVELWKGLLNLESIGIDDNFFDLGGTSLLSLELIAQINRKFNVDFLVVKLFQYPSIGLLANLLSKSSADVLQKIYQKTSEEQEKRFGGIAIIGMAGRFPGAESLSQLWKNLCEGVESIDWFTREELGPGIDEELRNDPDYIPARGIVKDADMFDAAFFGISPLEAKVIDPQQRVFLEIAWNALDNAGYDSSTYDGDIGVFAGIGDNHYYTRNLICHKDLLRAVGNLSVEYGNQKDYIATRTCFALNLTGPGVSVNTGCSTTLLAIDLAVRSLRDRECDMAIAGGADIHVPQKSGFLYQKSGTFAKDGHCRPFDADATGTMFCDGAGAVVLKRLEDAIADNDTIYAVITATAKNNDGSSKVSFLAPSVEGQSRVIAAAQALAGVDPEEIGYVEAHGTATPIGDPIEIEALTRAFRVQTDKKQFCWIGSIKGNIGHPTIAAGVAGIIKASLCLYHGKIPATLHYKQPNPQIDFKNSPFKVIDHLQEWPRGDKPRFAAVSSFGFGGTNTHAILREAPALTQSGPSRPVQLLLLSAKSSWSLDTLTASLKEHIGRMNFSELADAAFTLQCGRRALPQRRFVVVGCDDGVKQLQTLQPPRSATRLCSQRDPEVVFLFPGQGSQYVQMGRQLYATEPLFRQTIDRCCSLLMPYLGRDLRSVIHPEKEDEKSGYEALKDTFFTQPALFTIEYSLALLWMSWGIKPSMMVGHSIGEFAVACIAGVFTLEDALKLVATRGRLMKELPRGSMLSVRCAAEKIEARLPPAIQLAAANGPSLCVVSGPDDAMAVFQKELEAEGLVCRPLHTSHAFHSAMMDPIVPVFTKVVAGVSLHQPKLPFFSSFTGRPITEAEATDPAYWGRHLRMPVRFSDAAKLLVEKKNTIFLEVGPRTTLMTLMRQHAEPGKDQAFAASLSENAEGDNELITLLSAIGQLWINGFTIDWRAFYQFEKRRRVPLPGYPFERKRHWVDPVPENPCSVRSPDETTITEKEASDNAPPPVVLEKISAVDEIKDRLTAILSETSGIPKDNLNPATTFLDLGMDSLFLTQAAFQIQKEFNIKITFGQLLKDYPTISVLSEHIKSTTVGSSVVKVISNDKTNNSITGVLRLSSTLPQRGIWFSSQLGIGPSCAYNESLSLKFDGAVDIPLLKKSIEFLARKHHALTARFEHDGSIMVLDPDCLPSISVINRTPHDRSEFDALSKEQARTEASTPFNLEKGPLFRANILHTDAATVVIFTGHHIICDGWSLDVIVEDLFSAYQSYLKNLQPVGTLEFTFAHYVNDRVKRESTVAFQNQKTFWQNLYRNGLPLLQLPIDAPRPPLRLYNAHRLDRIIPAEIIDRLHTIGKSQSSSFFSTFLAGLGVLIHAVSGTREVVIGLPTAEQARINQRKLVGHCVNIIPLLITIDPGQPFTALVAGTQQRLIEAYDNQDYTLIHLLAEMPGAAQVSKAPPVAVGLTSVKRWEPSELPDIGMPVDYWANPKCFESFELYFNAVESATQTILTCHYNTTIFRQERIEQWLDSFLQLLSMMAASPYRTISEYLSEVHFTYIRSAPSDELCRVGDTGPGISGILLPASVLEDDLKSIWQRSLSIKEIDRTTSFFDAGGHSLLAAKLFAEIERVLGIKAPLALLYEAPSIAQMAVALDRLKKSGNTWKNIIPIKTGGKLSPLFLIHGAEGNVLLYRDLAKYLPDDLPLYGIQSSGLDNIKSFDATFETVAANYVRQIRELQPEGPYYIGGYCLGGVIALEVAQQLRIEGERIAFLCMLENYNIKVMQWPMPWHYRFLNNCLNLYFHIGNLMNARSGSKLAFFKTKATTEWKRFRVSFLLTYMKFFDHLGKKDATLYPHLHIAHMYDEALIRYEPQKYSGTLHLFVAYKRFAGFTDPLWGWGGVADYVSLNELPVFPRGTLVEPYVRILAERLNNALKTSTTLEKATVSSE